MSRRKRTAKSSGVAAMVFLLCLACTLAACSVGPTYQRPPAPVPPEYRQSPPRSGAESGAWKVAQPRDDVPRGKWWEIFEDPQLNELQEQIEVSSQTLAIAEAQFRAARAAITIARAPLFPTLTGSVEIRGSRLSANRPGGQGRSPGPRADYVLPLDLFYEADLWGRIRRTVEASTASAEASAADLENVRLSLHAELALAYFTLRGLDAEKRLLEMTVEAFERALELATNRYNQGVASQVDVLQARTQLETARSQVIDISLRRAQVEHAIATLIGKSPAQFSLPPSPMTREPPPIPAGLPSELLERRPDIAAAERRVAAANAQLGIAEAAFFPTLTLRASFGLESSNLANLFSWPSHLWSIGGALVELALDRGRRKAVSEQVQAVYDATVAAYRQSVLVAFQGVENNLAALRILEEEAQQQAKAVQAAQRLLALAMNRYRGGVTTYLEVITAQNAALAAERTAVDLLTRRMTAAVSLIRALGGGWNEHGEVQSAHR